MDEKITCFSCGKKEMFENQARGMTCGSCGQLLFPISAKEHAELLNMLTDFQKALTKTNEVCKLQEKLIKTYQEKENAQEKYIATSFGVFTKP